MTKRSIAVRSRLGMSVLILLGTLFAIAPATPASGSITPAEFERCLLESINADRAAAGAAALELAADKTDAVRAWSQWMSDHDFRHMHATERDPILPPDRTSWAENIAWTSDTSVPDCAGVHAGFMNSDGHRRNILDPEQRFVALGAHVDASGWWITELFFASPTYSPGCEERFCDTDGSVFAADIEALAAAGITKGCNPPVNDRFCPERAVTRGAMAAFLVRALGLTETSSVEFSDVGGSVFEADISKLAAAGITKGCNPPVNDRFCPERAVTRGAMAAFLVRALGLTETSSVEFSDVGGSVFEADISKLAAAGITKGCNPPVNDRFCPERAVTRGAMAAFLVRALDL